MRISIREQLSLLVLLCALGSLMILALATWFTSRDFVINIRLSSLALTASLKAAQLSSTILLYDSQARSVSTRILIQNALQRYNNGNSTDANWVNTQLDLSGALSNGQLFLQAAVFAATNNNTGARLPALVNVTSDGIAKTITLPGVTYSNGSSVFLGDPGLGYPPSLYPNFTSSGDPFTSDYAVESNGKPWDPDTTLFYGPLLLDNQTALFSVTTGVFNNSAKTQILGFITLLVNGSMVMDIRNSQEGLDKTGEVLIVGPDTVRNVFDFDVRTDNATGVLDEQLVRFILPPSSAPGLRSRHAARENMSDVHLPFLASSFPAIEQAWTVSTGNINNAGSMLDTHNEAGKRVAVGYAQVKTPIVDWIMLVEQDHGEVVQPINHLRDIVLICVFSVAGGLMLLTFPLAHYMVAPVRQLRAATQKTVDPYQPDDSQSNFSGLSDYAEEEPEYDEQEARKEGFLASVSNWASKTNPRTNRRQRRTRRTFRIPSKVPERRHIIYDELTDLTSKFNEMSDELVMQYQRLEERVKLRTAELEKAKQAAEAANQSKTLFIANISHELKTPLNGILGLTQICMGEDDHHKIRSTLGTIYKSGDLLLHLLTDLLTFSKNEVGQQLAIDEAEFKLSDLATQLLPTFDRQAKEGHIKLEVLYSGTCDSLGNQHAEGDKDYGPSGTGKVRDMAVWGDKNRILQVLMNFASNSLKFTPPDGSVTVRIRCLGVIEEPVASAHGSIRKSSLNSRKSKTSSKKRVRTSDTSLVGNSDSEDGMSSTVRHRLNGSLPASDSDEATKSILKKSHSYNAHHEGKLNINVGSGTTQIDKVVKRTRSKSPPPLNTKDLDFEFEVEDTGPGIPEEQQRKIFEPFVQGDLGLSKKYGGTGLGLSICAQLAALMGGELSLDSQIGRGSKFSMRIPLRYVSQRKPSLDSSGVPLSHTNSLKHSGNRPSDAFTTGSDETFTDVPRVMGLSQPFVTKEVARTQPVHSPSSELKIMKTVESEAAKLGRKVRVLVAEDNKINQEVVLRMLKLEAVYDVTIAKDGQEAYERVKESMQDSKKRFHLIFMDVQMPNMDGIQSTKMIRGMGFSAPIVALTAFAEKSNEDECMASGMDYFLAKPIKRPALKQVLKKYCATITEEECEETPSPFSQPVSSENYEPENINGFIDLGPNAPMTPVLLTRKPNAADAGSSSNAVPYSEVSKTNGVQVTTRPA